MHNVTEDRLEHRLHALSLPERLQLLANAAPHVVFSTSFSLEDQLITHYIATQKLPIRIFTLDTGRLFEQTYTTWQTTLEHYPGLQIAAYTPEHTALSALIAQQGVNGFYHSKENRLNCCHVRKVEPLARALTGADIWISGLRREQSSTRANLTYITQDTQHQLYKALPLLEYDEPYIRHAITEYHIPHNPLHHVGYPSIGCAPCTRAIEAGEHPRAGRWWWEQDSTQECGLHLVDGKLQRNAPHYSI